MKIIYIILFLFPSILIAQTCNTVNVVSNAPDNRYTVNGDGTVTDNQTGLIWMQCTLGQIWNNGVCEGDEVTYNWSEALIAAESENFSGNQNWHLPNIKQLSSLVDFSCSTPASNISIFSFFNVDLTIRITNEYWTSSTVQNESDTNSLAWVIVFFDGVVAPREKTSEYFLRLVRYPESEEEVNNDVTCKTEAFVGQHPEVDPWPITFFLYQKPQILGVNLEREPIEEGTKLRLTQAVSEDESLANFEWFEVEVINENSNSDYGLMWNEHIYIDENNCTNGTHYVVNKTSGATFLNKESNTTGGSFCTLLPGTLFTLTGTTETTDYWQEVKISNPLKNCSQDVGWLTTEVIKEL
ncbi:MAG: hypothetical protein COB38_12395 [Gammaproteobacteria bacterium]|nr:MAG: hypothetical protein COB38_12395 [Gammaproteobacteria bacterium]